MTGKKSKNIGNRFEEQANNSLVENLEVKLLLITGDMDDNVPPALTINLVNDLIKANKDFDFLLLPNANHSLNKKKYFENI